MKISVLTIFPEMFSAFLQASLLGKAIENKLLSVNLINIRDFAEPPHNRVDDEPYGGGAGMVMKPEPLSAAIESAKKNLPNAPVVLLSPGGELFNQQEAEKFSKLDGLILVCGRYEGVDQRVIDTLIDREISIGNYVLMGGEVAAMVMIEASARLIEDVVGNPESLLQESFSPKDRNVIEGPQYTRPAEFRGETVPEVLLSGNHKLIAEWRKEKALEKTKRRGGINAK